MSDQTDKKTDPDDETLRLSGGGPQGTTSSSQKEIAENDESSSREPSGD